MALDHAANLEHHVLLDLLAVLVDGKGPTAAAAAGRRVEDA